MIKKSREEILAINPVFSTHLILVQDDKYNPAHYLVEEGDEVFLEEENMTVSLTKEEAEQINHEDQLFYKDTKDNYAPDDSVKWVAREKLIPATTDKSAYLETLSDVFQQLANLYPNQSLQLMGDWPTPWLIEKGKGKPSQDAYKFFKNHCKATFNGGFIVTNEELKEVIPHLFWLSRGSDILPDLLFGFEKGETVFSICKHGVIHIECYDSEEHQSIVSCLASADLTSIDSCKDPIKF